MATQSDVGVCSLALAALGQEAIQSLAAPVKPNEKLMALIYPQVRDAELRRHRWRFALEWRRLTPTGSPVTIGPYGTLNRYQLPTDALRAVRHEGDQWRVMGRQLHDPSSTYIDVELVIQKTPAEFDPLFVDVLTYRLAVRATEKITTSNEKLKNLEGLLQDAIDAAKQVNAFEAGPEAWVSQNSTAYSWEDARRAV